MREYSYILDVEKPFTPLEKLALRALAYDRLKFEGYKNEEAERHNQERIKKLLKKSNE